MDKEEINNTIDINYYLLQIDKHSKITKEAIRQKVSFLQNVLLASTSIVGILISLHNNNSQCLNIQLVFLLSVVLLSFGILCLALVLFDFSTIECRSAESFRKEIGESIENGVPLNLVPTTEKKFTSFFEVCSYVFLLMGFISLVIYSVLDTLK